MSSHYDSFNYPEFWQGRIYEDRAERIALKSLLGFIGPKDSIADIGGGFGRLATTYASYFRICLVVDPSEKMLNIGKKNLKEYHNVFFNKGSLPNLDFPDQSFDVVILNRVIHHLKDPTPSIREMNRIVKKSGYLILEIANKIHFLSRLRFLFSKEKLFSDLQPLDLRRKKNINNGAIVFVKHHPKKIMSELKENGFNVREILSVSNFRHPLFKKIIPLSFLLFLEKNLQRPLSHIFFGPSIFMLAEKV